MVEPQPGRQPAKPIPLQNATEVCSNFHFILSFWGQLPKPITLWTFLALSRFEREIERETEREREIVRETERDRERERTGERQKSEWSSVTEVKVTEESVTEESDSKPVQMIDVTNMLMLWKLLWSCRWCRGSRAIMCSQRDWLITVGTGVLPPSSVQLATCTRPTLQQGYIAKTRQRHAVVELL